MRTGSLAGVLAASGLFGGLFGGLFEREAIPESVHCHPELWCDDVACTRVCGRGTVIVPEWIDSAHRLQHLLSSSLPLCRASLLGSHNSAITLADGYGNQDGFFSGLLKYATEWLAPEGAELTIRTNDQYFSLTDQLNMGVRMVELDTHYVLGELRIAHCGGLHLDALNKLVEALNYVAKTLGFDVRWDTETVGCNPSLSSIPAASQRLLRDALGEIKAWMDEARNVREFLIVYLDDEPDLLDWGVVPELVAAVRDAFPDDRVFKPPDRAAAASPDAGWPTMGELLDAGFRVMFVSSSDYGTEMEPYVFARGAVCNWQEPSLADIDASSCAGTARFPDGTLLRTPSCEIQYGPLNCDFAMRNENSPVLDEASLPGVLACGLNVPAPDLLTPQRAAAAVWTWAPGYPPSHPTGCDDVAYVAASDGRWRTATSGASCADLVRLPLACRVLESPLSRPSWLLVESPGVCPNGTVGGPPRYPRENLALVTKVRSGSHHGARIHVSHVSHVSHHL